MNKHLSMTERPSKLLTQTGSIAFPDIVDYTSVRLLDAEAGPMSPDRTTADGFAVNGLNIKPQLNDF